MVASIILSGCTHQNEVSGAATVFPGAFTAGGVTYYPAHPGTTNYGKIDYTTNPPPAGVKPFAIVVTTNAHMGVNMLTARGLLPPTHRQVNNSRASTPHSSDGCREESWREGPLILGFQNLRRLLQTGFAIPIPPISFCRPFLT
jgi:hypothetical protein